MQRSSQRKSWQGVVVSPLVLLVLSVTVCYAGISFKLPIPTIQFYNPFNPPQQLDPHHQKSHPHSDSEIHAHPFHDHHPHHEHHHLHHDHASLPPPPRNLPFQKPKRFKLRLSKQKRPPLISLEDDHGHDQHFFHPKPKLHAQSQHLVDIVHHHINGHHNNHADHHHHQYHSESHEDHQGKIYLHDPDSAVKFYYKENLAGPTNRVDIHDDGCREVPMNYWYQRPKSLWAKHCISLYQNGHCKGEGIQVAGMVSELRSAGIYYGVHSFKPCEKNIKIRFTGSSAATPKKSTAKHAHHRKNHHH